MLYAISDMFQNPQERLAVQIEKLWDYREFQEEYVRKAEESAENANADMDTELIGVKIVDAPEFVVTAGPAPPSVASRVPDPLPHAEPKRFYDDAAKLLVGLGESEILMDDFVPAGPAPPPVAFRDPDPLAPPEPVRIYDDGAKLLVGLGESEILMD
jgi:hypothetical protein